MKIGWMMPVLMVAGLMAAGCSRRESAYSAIQQKAEEALSKAAEISAAAAEAAKAAADEGVKAAAKAEEEAKNAVDAVKPPASE